MDCSSNRISVWVQCQLPDFRGKFCSEVLSCKAFWHHICSHHDISLYQKMLKDFRKSNVIEIQSPKPTCTCTVCMNINKWNVLNVYSNCYKVSIGYIFLFIRLSAFVLQPTRQLGQVGQGVVKRLMMNGTCAWWESQLWLMITTSTWDQGGVDKSDQLLFTYNLLIKSMRVGGRPCPYSKDQQNDLQQ